MNKQIVFYSELRFGHHNREAEEKMIGFARRGYHVVYVNQLGVRNPKLRHLNQVMRALRPGGAGGESADAPFDVVNPKLAPPRRFPLVNTINERWLARQLRAHLESGRGTILWIRFATPELVPFIEEAGWDIVVYEVVDPENHAGLPRHLQRLLHQAEQRILDRAELVFVPSEVLGQALRPRHANVVVAPHPIDVDRFSVGAAEREPRERLAVYVGALDFRFDAKLVAEVATRLPQWTFRLAGPVLERAAATQLGALPNVELLGARPWAEIPSLIADATTCLMPYRRTQFTDQLSPVKLIEYLASGRPIVSTRVRAVTEFAGVVAIADDAADFARAVDASRERDSVAERLARIEAARPYALESRIDAMEAAIAAAGRVA